MTFELERVVNLLWKDQRLHFNTMEGCVEPQHSKAWKGCVASPNQLNGPFNLRDP